MSTVKRIDRPADTVHPDDGCRNPRPLALARERGSRRNRRDAAIRVSMRQHGPR